MTLQKRLRNILDSPAGVAIIVVILLFLQLPYFFAVIPAVLSILFKVRLASLLFLLFCLAVLGDGIRKLLRQEILLWLCLAWSVLMCISMYLNGKTGAEILTVLKDILLPSWIAILLFSVFCRVNARRLVAALFFYYLIINTLNNASVMFFRNTGIWTWPHGDRNPEYIFFGHINEGIVCGMNSILFGSLWCLRYERKWMSVHWINIGYSFCTALVIDCVDQMFIYGVAAVALLCILSRKKPLARNLLRIFNFRNLMILNGILVCGITILVLTGWIERTGLYSLLHGRQELWREVLRSIREHPILGNGYTSWLQAVMHYGDIKYFWHQHSLCYQVLYETGITGAVLYILMFLACIRRSGACANKEVRFCAEVIVGFFFLALLVEVCVRSEVFLLMGTLCCLPVFGKKELQSAQGI